MKFGLEGQGNMWAIYILECADSSYYTGATNDLENRLKDHNAGKGARYTAVRRPVKLVYQEEFSSKQAALTRESQIKNYGRRN